MKRNRSAFILGAVLVLGSLASCASAGNQAPAQAGTHEATPSSAAVKNDAYANIPSSQIQKSTTYTDFEWNNADPYYGYTKAPIVGRAKIDSIAGGRTYSPVSEQVVFPQTFGKLTITQSFKGALKAGTQVDYYRVGGIVSYEDYWKSLNPEQQDKILHLNGGTKPTSMPYVEKKIDDDVSIEVGKEYLVLLQPQTSKDGSVTEYSIIGFQHGLREIKGAGLNATVLNNDSKAWEALNRAVKLP